MSSSFIIFICIIALLSAMQDSIVEEYKKCNFHFEDNKIAVINYVFGVRRGVLIGSCGALIISDYTTWAYAFKIISMCLWIGIFASLFIKNSIVQTGTSHNLLKKYSTALLRIYKLNNLQLLLIFLIGFKMSNSMVTIMLNPYLLELKF